MIRCAKCKRVTPSGEPTGLFVTQKEWKDTDESKHKDIVHAEIVCMGCNGVRILK